MSALIAGYITLEKLEQIVATVKAKQAKGFKFTASVNDESKAFQSGDKTVYQNVGLYAEQTEEQRTAKAPKWFFGNGGVFWTNGVAVKAGPAAGAQAAAAPAAAPVSTNLPF